MKKIHHQRLHIKRRIVNSLSAVGVIAIALGVYAQFHLTEPVMAITPPDSCFDFDAGTGTINQYYWNENNNWEEDACPMAVDIPTSIDGTPVTKIGDGAFTGHGLTELTIPDSVTEIGGMALASNNFTSIVVPDSVHTLGYRAFADNSQLISFTVTGDPAALGGDILRDTPLLESISYNGTTYTMSTSMTTPDDVCFWAAGDAIGAYFLKELSIIKSDGVACWARDIAIPSNIGGVEMTSIAGEAFRNKELTSVAIPSSITSVGEYAFFNNNLTSVAIPDSVTSIGLSAFTMNRLTSVVLPNGLDRIEGSVFSGNQLSEITIPDSVTQIGDGAFTSNHLDSVTIPSSVQHIADSAFIYQRPADNWNYHFARLYTADPSNPQGLEDGIQIDTYCDEYNEEDWSCLRPRATAKTSHLINPASVTLNYFDQQDNSISTSQTFVGPGITTYDWSPSPELTINDGGGTISPEERATLAARFYRLGDEVTFTPELIPGYTTPPPQTVTLSSADNPINFTYNAHVTTVPFADKAVTGGVLVPATPPADVTNTLVTASSLSLAEHTDCQTISQAHLLAPTALDVADDVTILGGLDFTLGCTTAGSTTVRYTLGSLAPDTARLRVYKHNPATNETTDITSLVTFTTVDGKTVLSYALTDGKDLDQDGQENGIIVDPVYIGIQEVAIPTSPTEVKSKELAETGANMWLIAVGGAILLVGGVVVSIMALQRRM